MKLGEKIKQLRQDAGLTQPELAEKAQIEQSYLSKLENEKGSPSFEVISKIASAFDMDVFTLIDSLSMSYLQENLQHIPEIAVKLESRREAKKQKMRRSYVLAAMLIVLGVAFVIIGNSSTIFPCSVYQYKSMGLINQGEINKHYQMSPLRELAEDWDKSNKRIAKNIARLDESLILTRSYQGEGFVEGYGNKRRYYELIDVREIESPMKDLAVVFGFIFLLTGGFMMIYLFKWQD
ncbi:helix-turn-helix domain-containing protein [Colwellia sp. 1_MG-2023]|uniref:helix-turn-helix domain-containing protein n=1 Tax=Colwellia sp. 1_MG-2023 TaxID=3062649 RepID=UPI0026E46F50|nr:helix-turn-helix domain-containing protein [Colwellia sp. 1_MG-2023]MDO6446767.1 helix-turn-helix domain-containing protein [Colwellia sp. 1_MG-2023]